MIGRNEKWAAYAFLGAAVSIPVIVGLIFLKQEYKKIAELNIFDKIRTVKPDQHGIATLLASTLPGIIPKISLVTNPNHIVQIFRFNSEIATRSRPLRIFGDLVGAESILLMNNIEAKPLREKLIRWLQGEARLKKVGTEILHILQEEYLKDINHRTKDLQRFCTCFTMDVFCRTILGYRLKYSNSASLLSDCVNEIFKVSVDPMALFGLKKTGKILKEKLKTMFEEHLELRVDTKGFVHELIDTQGINPYTLTGKEIIYSQASTLLIAGHETTALVLQFALRLLALSENREILDKLRGELRAKISPDFSGFNSGDVPYLRQFIKEILRLYPPTAFFPRGIEKDLLLLDKNVGESEYEKEVLCFNLNPQKYTNPASIKISKGEILIASPYIIQRLESLWGMDAKEFKPERFNNSDEQRLITGKDTSELKFFPFGIGPRHCVGWQFSVREIELFLAAFILTCNFSIDCHVPDGLMELEAVATLRPKNSASITLQPCVHSIPSEEISLVR